MGEFIDLLDELAEYPAFRNVVLFARNQQQDGTPEEFVLRFFAFGDRYRQFDHSVRDFLNDYCGDAANHPDLAQRTRRFEQTFDFLARCFPNGLRSRKGSTPVNLFEGVAVGAWLALQQDPQLRVPSSLDWVYGDQMKAVTTGATNTRSRVFGRIELARDRFLAGA